jgi:hypothetical protein
MTALTRRPAATAVVVALLGLAAGLGVRFGLAGLPGRPWAATATANVVDVRLTPDGAQAVVDVTLVTSVAAEVSAAEGSGLGIAVGDRRVPLTRTAPLTSPPQAPPATTPSTPADVDPDPDTSAESSKLLARHHWFTVPLSCAGSSAPVAGPTRFILSVTTRSGARHEVSGPGTLAWTGATQVDLCSYAEHQLPIGWEHPVTVDSFAPDKAYPATARLTVSGLAPGDRVTETFTSAELAIDAPVVGTADDHGRISMSLHLNDGCQNNGWRIPVGVSVSGASPEVGTTAHYVGVGLPLARWIVDYRISHCSGG